MTARESDGKALSSVTPRRPKRKAIGDERRISGSDDGSEMSTPSTDTDLEMEDMNSDYGDEEATLATDERRRNLLKTRFHSHDASDVPLTKHEKRMADRAVTKSLLINAMLIALWYLFATSISVYNKWMFAPDRLNFHFPLFTTALHMLVQFSLASTILYFFPKLRPSTAPSYSHPSTATEEASSKHAVTSLFYITRLVPCGVATALDIGLGNTSLKFITLTFLTMCKSSALAFVLLFAFIFRLETPSWKLILIIATMTVGVIMMVAGEAAFNAIGFSLIIASAFFSGFRWALTQILLLRHPATSNPFATLFFIAPIEFVALFLLALAAEGPLEVINGIGILIAKEGTFQGICLLIFPGFLAFCMLSSEFALLQRTNVVTLSICGIFKEVVTISAAEIFYHDPLTPINISGLLVTIASIGAYNYLKVTKMRREARKKVHAVEAEGAVRDSLGGGDDEERQGLVSNSDPSGGLRRTESPSGSNRSSSPPKRTRDLD